MNKLDRLLPVKLSNHCNILQVGSNLNQLNWYLKVLHLGSIYPVGYLTNLATQPYAFRASALPTFLSLWPFGYTSQDDCLDSSPFII
jgi:hypothetical protein